MFRFLVGLSLALHFGLLHADSIEAVNVVMTGSEANGSRIYVGITPNSVGCLNGGVYFTTAAELNRVLAVALAAKVSGGKVRVDYNQPGGPGTQCIGNGIYAQ